MLALAELDLPPQPDGVSVWVLLDPGAGAVALPMVFGSGEIASLLMPVTDDLEGRAVDALLIAEAADGALVWLCDAVTVDIQPLPSRPGGTAQFAAHLEALPGRLAPVLDLLPEGDAAVILSDMFEATEGLQTLAQDLTPEELAPVDDLMGAYLAALRSAPGSGSGGGAPAPAPDPTPTLTGFFGFAATVPSYRPPPGGSLPAVVRSAIADACPADPHQLTEYIELGMRARAHTDATAQFLLTTGLTLAGVSGRLVNAATVRDERIDTVLDKGVAITNTAQGIVGDYLAGMMPLNLVALEVDHTGATFFDDTPTDMRQVRVTSARLSTRSNGWNANKATLDLLIGAAALHSGGSISGQATRVSSSYIGGNAARLERITAALEIQVRAGRVSQAALDQARGFADGAALVRDLAVGTPVGVVEGLVAGQVTTSAGGSDWAPIPQQVARCTVDLTDTSNGRRPQHLFLSVAEGDADVAVPALEPPLALDIVGTGQRTALVQLNPSAAYFPIAHTGTLPEAVFVIDVARLDIDVTGPGPAIAAGETYRFEAQTAGTAEPPRLVWSVEPAIPIVEYGARSEAVNLTVPDDMPEGTLITLTVEAMGDFISSARDAPMEIVVLEIRRDGEAEPEEVVEYVQCTESMGLPPLPRPRNLASGVPLAGTWSQTVIFEVTGYLRDGATCRDPEIWHDQPLRPLEIAPDPDGLSFPSATGPVPLGRMETADFLRYLETYGWGLNDDPFYRNCLAPPGYATMSTWIWSPDTEIFAQVTQDRPGVPCMSFVLTDGNYLMIAENLSVDWLVRIYERP